MSKTGGIQRSLGKEVKEQEGNKKQAMLIKKLKCKQTSSLSQATISGSDIWNPAYSAFSHSSNFFYSYIKKS